LLTNLTDWSKGANSNIFGFYTTRENATSIIRKMESLGLGVRYGQIATHVVEAMFPYPDEIKQASQKKVADTAEEVA